MSPIYLGSTEVTPRVGGSEAKVYLGSTLVYEPAAPPATNPAARAGYDPPSTWPFQLDGLPLERLTLGTVEADRTRRGNPSSFYRRGRFQAFDGTLSGSVDRATQGNNRWCEVVRTGHMCSWWLINVDLSLDGTRQYQQLALWGGGETWDTSSRLRSADVPLAAGDVLRMLNATELAAWLA